MPDTELERAVVLATTVTVTHGGQYQAERHGRIVAVTDGANQWRTFPDGDAARVVILGTDQED